MSDRAGVVSDWERVTVEDVLLAVDALPYEESAADLCGLGWCHTSSIAWWLNCDALQAGTAAAHAARRGLLERGPEPLIGDMQWGLTEAGQECVNRLHEEAED